MPFKPNAQQDKSIIAHEITGWTFKHRNDQGRRDTCRCQLFGKDRTVIAEAIGRDEPDAFSKALDALVAEAA